MQLMHNESLETLLIFWSMIMIGNYVLTRLNGLVHTLMPTVGVGIRTVHSCTFSQ